MPSLKEYGLNTNWPGIGVLFDRHVNAAEVKLSDVPGIAVASYLLATGFKNQFAAKDKTYPTAPYFPSHPQYCKAQEIANG